MRPARPARAAKRALIAASASSTTNGWRSMPQLAVLDSGRRPAAARRGAIRRSISSVAEAIAARSSPSSRACRSASSSSILCSASGVRSSWLASSTNRRSRSSASSSRAEHRVQGLAEAAQLVVGLRAPAAAPRVRRPRSRPPGGASVDRAQRRAGQPVAGGGGEQERDRPADQQQPSRGCRAPRRGRRATSRRRRSRLRPPTSTGAASIRTVPSMPAPSCVSTNIGPVRDARSTWAGSRTERAADLRGRVDHPPRRC